MFVCSRMSVQNGSPSSSVLFTCLVILLIRLSLPPFLLPACVCGAHPTNHAHTARLPSFPVFCTQWSKRKRRPGWMWVVQPEAWSRV